MDFNNEIETIRKNIEELRSKRDELNVSIERKTRNLEEIKRNSKENGYKECPHCKKMSPKTEFSKIMIYEKNIECVYQGIINSGENEYAVVERVNTYSVCPKCNEKFLFNSQQISEGNWLRDRNVEFTPERKVIENRDYTYGELLRKQFKGINDTQDLTK